MDNKPTTAEILIVAGGAVTLVGSFLDFIGESNAWSTFQYLLVAVFGVAMAAQVALRVFAKTDTGSGVAGYSWGQIHLLLGFYCAVLMVATLVEGNGGFGWEIGFWAMLIGSIALLVGAVMLNQSSTSRPASSGPTV